MVGRARALAAWGNGLTTEYTRVRGSLAAGGLAYFVALSLVPIAVAFGSLAGLLLDPADVKEFLDELAARSLGGVADLSGVLSTLSSLVESASSSAFTIATIVSILLAIYGSSQVVAGLRAVLNDVFDLTEGFSGLVQRAIAAIVTLVLLVAAVLIVVLLTVVPRLLDAIGVAGISTTSGSWLVDWSVAVLLLYLAIRLLYRHAPTGGRPVRWMCLGAATATAGIAIVTAGLGVYVGLSGRLGATIAVLGTAVVVLLWLYLCFQMIIWGAIIEAARERSATADVRAG